MKILFYGNFGSPHSSESVYLRALLQMGHEIITLQEGQATTDEIEAYGTVSDLFFWVHTHGWMTNGRPVKEALELLKQKKIPTVGYHLDLWLGLDRLSDLENDSYWLIDEFFTADRDFADYLNQHDELPRGHYLKPGVPADECRLPDTIPTTDVVFIGSGDYPHKEWPYRKQLIDWLHATYGDRFKHYGNGGLTTVRGEELNRAVADAKIVIGDSLCKDFKKTYYWSERIYDQIGRGAFMIHPYIKGLEEEFKDKEHLVYYKYGDFDQLKNLIDYYLEHEDERLLIRAQGQKMVAENCTYTDRLKEMLKICG